MPSNDWDASEFSGENTNEDEAYIATKRREVSKRRSDLSANPGEPFYEVLATGIQLTPAGLRALEDMAAEGLSIATCAMHLGVTRSWLRKALQETSGDNPVCEAYEVGKGRFADETTSDLRVQSGRGSVIASIWLAKSRHGHRDNEVIQEASKHVHIHFPESMTMEQYQLILERKHQEQLAAAMASAPSGLSSASPVQHPQLIEAQPEPEMPDFLKAAIEQAKEVSDTNKTAELKSKPESAVHNQESVR